MKYVPKRAPKGINSAIESPLKDAFTLLVAAAVVVLLLFLALGVFANSFAKKMDYQTERSLFQSTDESPKTPDEQKLQGLVNRLWHQYPESKGAPLQVSILTSTQMNAFMSIGGQMGVTTALLEKVKYENELAFVICHEIGHFYHRDVLKGMGHRLGLAMALSLLGFAGSVDLVSLSSESLSLAFDRKQEQEADDFAIDCMHKQYGHLQSYDQFFKWVLVEKSFIPEVGRKALSFMQTHPLTEKRIARLAEQIDKKGFPQKGKLQRWSKSKLGSKALSPRDPSEPAPKD